MTGIISYGTYIPESRIKVGEIASFWKKDADEVVSSLGVTQKAVAALDEDAVTLAVTAGSRALNAINLTPEKLEAIFVGSESHPYAVNPTSTIVGEFLGVGNHYFAADFEFACKAATASMQVLTGLLDSKRIQYGMSIGSDTAQAAPHDILEYTAGSGAAAFVLGVNEAEVIAQITDFVSYTSDTPDFWRRDGMRYPSHGGRFTGEPAYYTHVMGASELLFAKTKTKPSDFDYCVFHMPNGKFPAGIARRLGFSADQLNRSLLVSTIGNPYSASSLLGLASVLDHAKPNERIFFCSYGSGAGSDAFMFETTKQLARFKQTHLLEKQLTQTKQIGYAEYLKKTKVI